MPEPHADIALALRHEKEGRSAEGMTLLAAAARSGDMQAAYLVALRLLKGQAQGPARAQAFEFIRQAASAGITEAVTFEAVAHAVGLEDGRPNWRAAVSTLQAAAARGDELARAQLATLPNADPLLWINAPPPATRIFPSPRVGVIEGFLPRPMCDWLIERTRPRLAPAEIMNEAGQTLKAATRTNLGAHIALEHSDLVIQTARARIGTSLGVPIAHQEFPNVLNYNVGQQFRPHVDFLDPAIPGMHDDLKRGGQRIATFLIYLNEAFEGGETDFPNLNWRYKGKTGDALFFWNVSAAGQVERQLVHAGMPPTKGEKWLFSQWVRSKPLPLI